MMATTDWRSGLAPAFEALNIATGTFGPRRRPPLVPNPQDGSDPSIPDIPPDPNQPPATPPSPQAPSAYDPLAQSDKLYPPTKYHPTWQVASFDQNGKLIGIRDAQPDEIPGGGGLTPYESGTLGVSQGHLALAEHQAAIDQAQKYVQLLQAERDAMLQRAQASQGAQLKAAPYALNDLRWQPGYGPNDPLVALGLATATPVRGSLFDPSLSAEQEFDPIIAHHLSQLA